jgi:transposase
MWPPTGPPRTAQAANQVTGGKAELPRVQIMARPRNYSKGLRRRDVDEVLERGRKIPEVASQLGIGSPETLRKWVRQAEADRGLREAPTTEELAQIKALKKEVADQARTIDDPQGGHQFFRQGGRPAPAVTCASSTSTVIGGRWR